VTNVGYSPAYDIVVEDRLPKGFVYMEESAVLTWPGGELQLEPVLTEDSVLTWITGLSLDPGESLSIVFTARVTEEAAVGEEAVNVMRAEGVDFFNVPIPPDSSMYVPEDTDPEDTAILKLKILPSPSGTAVPPSAGGPRRRGGFVLLGLSGLGGLLAALRRSRFLGLSLLLLLGVSLLALPQEPQYAVILVSDPPGAGTLFGAGTYKEGELVQVSALPNLGFELVGWFEDEEVISSSPFLDFPAERDRVLLARFRPVLEFEGLRWQSQGRLSILPAPALEFGRLEIRPRFRFGPHPWDLRAVLGFTSATWNDAQFHLAGTWGKARFGGGLFFRPLGPAYRSAYAMFSMPIDNLRLGLRVTHYPRYGTPPAPALLPNVTLSLPGRNLTLRFEEKTGLVLKDATVSFYNLSLCCDLTFNGTMVWRKEGVRYARFSIKNIPLGCGGLSADLAVTFSAESKSVEFTPHWLFCDPCLTIYGDVLWDPGTRAFQGLALYGYKIRCCFPEGSVEFLTAFDPGRVPGGFRGQEFEYLRFTFCGPGCCGGTYKLELTSFFQPTDGPFGLSRAVASASIPLAPGLTLEPKMEIPVGGNVSLSLGWTWR